MATIKKPPSGSWRVQARRKGHYLSNSFVLRKDAETWARLRQVKAAYDPQDMFKGNHHVPPAERIRQAAA